MDVHPLWSRWLNVQIDAFYEDDDDAEIVSVSHSLVAPREYLVDMHVEVIFLDHAHDTIGEHEVTLIGTSDTPLTRRRLYRVFAAELACFASLEFTKLDFVSV